MKLLTDNDMMPFGKHKGQRMANVPASYLLWLYERWRNGDAPKSDEVFRVKVYVDSNLEVLRMEVKRTERMGQYRKGA